MDSTGTARPRRDMREDEGSGEYEKVYGVWKTIRAALGRISCFRFPRPDDPRTSLSPLLLQPVGTEHRMEIGPLHADTLCSPGNTLGGAIQGGGEKSSFQIIDDLPFQSLEVLPRVRHFLRRDCRLGLADLTGQVAELDPRSTVEYGQPLDDVAQLADVARPWVYLQLADRLVREPLHFHAHLPREAIQESVRQQHDVAVPIAQGEARRAPTFRR